MTLELIAYGGSSALEAELTYDPRCPFAVTVAFASGPRTVRWTFGRDLLRKGLFEPAGDGDVHVRPELDMEGRAVVIIELRSPEGIALVQARARDVHRFVQAMTTAVRPGTESEHLDIDATIEAVLVANHGE